MVINGLVASASRIRVNDLPSLPINVQTVNKYDLSSGICCYFTETGDQIRCLPNYEADKASEKITGSSACTKIICLDPKVAIQMCLSGLVLHVDIVMDFMSFLLIRVTCHFWPQVNASSDHRSMRHVPIMATSQCVTSQLWPQIMCYQSALATGCVVGTTWIPSLSLEMHWWKINH